MAWAVAVFGSWFDLALLYGQYAWQIDSLAYLLVFTSIVHAVVSRRFQGRPAAGISIAFGAALALGAASSARAAGFTLGSLGPVALLVVLVLAAVLVFQFARDLGAPALRAAAASAVLLSVGVGVLDHAALWWLDSTGLLGLVQFSGVLGVLVLAFELFSKGGKPLRGRFGAPSGFQDQENAGHVSVVNAARHGVFRPSRTPIQILENLRTLLASDEPNEQILCLVDELQQAERRLVSVYKKALGQLARGRHRRASGMSPGQREVLVAAQRNIAEYDRAVMVLVEAAAARNRRLCLEAVERALRFEVDGLRLAKLLLGVLREKPKRI